MEEKSRQRSLHIGMGGWELEPFNRLFYPPRPKKGFRKLEYYSQFFDCIEINSTFYSTALTPVHARRWVADVSGNANFVFTVKLFQGFTHTYTATREDVVAVQRLLDVIAGAGRLGGVLLQFPYSFTNVAERRAYLMQFSKLFPSSRLFVEVRHASWNTPSMYNFFQENKLHLVNVDLPQIRQHIPLNALGWNGAAYFRMMGRNGAAWKHPWRMEEDGKHMVSDRYKYYYSKAELGNLLYYIDRARAESNKVFVIFHNDPEANSLVNGFQLRHLARHRHRVLVPQNFVHKFPVLKDISAPVNVFHPLFAEQE